MGHSKPETPFSCVPGLSELQFPWEQKPFPSPPSPLSIRRPPESLQSNNAINKGMIDERDASSLYLPGSPLFRCQINSNKNNKWDLMRESP